LGVRFHLRLQVLEPCNGLIQMLRSFRSSVLRTPGPDFRLFELLSSFGKLSVEEVLCSLNLVPAIINALFDEEFEIAFVISNTMSGSR